LCRRFQVLRWSALAFGVFYGFSHQRTITASSKAAADRKAYEHKKHLIEQAKAEYKKKQEQSSTTSTTQKSGCMLFCVATTLAKSRACLFSSSTIAGYWILIL
jgi:hypothetical protein